MMVLHFATKLMKHIQEIACETKWVIDYNGLEVFK